MFDTVAETASSDLDHYLKQACHSCLRASVNHTHILEMGKGSELHRCVPLCFLDTDWGVGLPTKRGALGLAL